MHGKLAFLWAYLRGACVALHEKKRGDKEAVGKRDDIYGVILLAWNIDKSNVWGRGMNVIKGPVAIAVGKYWLGIASGNRRCKKLRMTVERAIKDAEKLEKEKERDKDICKSDMGIK